MLARIRKSLEHKDDKGFTLIELLVVMIIIGILAAIAIPIFLSQRKKAEDSAAKADVSTLGKEIATWFVDAQAGPVITQTATGADYFIGADKIGSGSNNVRLQNGDQSSRTAVNWCVSVVNLQGDVARTLGFQYSAAGGLESGNCGTAVPAT